MTDDLPEVLLAPNIKTRHGFFTRNGGVSSGVYGTLNCAFNTADHSENINENRRRISSLFATSPDKLITLEQIHSAQVITLTEPPPTNARLQGDALVTNCREIVLGILTADCAPVLLHDEDAGIIAAVHSGWKGTLANIVQQTVHAMQRLGAVPQRMSACIGPCISQPSYEVGPEFPAAFIEAGYAAYFFPSPTEGHFLFSLRGCLNEQLLKAGVGNIGTLPYDTCSDETRFFSNRRSQKQGEPEFGRQLSAIQLD